MRGQLRPTGTAASFCCDNGRRTSVSSAIRKSRGGLATIWWAPISRRDGEGEQPCLSRKNRTEPPRVPSVIRIATSGPDRYRARFDIVRSIPCHPIGFEMSFFLVRTNYISEEIAFSVVHINISRASVLCLAKAFVSYASSNQSASGDPLPVGLFPFPIRI
jgi:hypothetical protein